MKTSLSKRKDQNHNDSMNTVSLCPKIYQISRTVQQYLFRTLWGGLRGLNWPRSDKNMSQQYNSLLQD